MPGACNGYPAEACASSTTVGSSSGFRNSGWAGWLESLHVVEGTEAGLISAGQVPRSSSMIEKVKFATGSLVEGD
jgi:hypothetical protein